MRLLKVLKEVATPVALFVLIVIALYTHMFTRSDTSPSPHGHTSDPAVVQLGREYGRALVKAAADTLDASASRRWTSTSQAAQENLADFDERLGKAWRPVASELTKRFGPTSEERVDAEGSAEIRQFWRDLAVGIHEEARP